MPLQEKNASIAADLLEISKRQSENISQMADSVNKLYDQVQKKPSRSHVYGFTSVVLVVVLIVVSLQYFQLKRNSDLVKDCVSAVGTCRQQRVQDNNSSDLKIICTEEKQTVIFESKLGEPYKPPSACKAQLEASLNIVIPPDGIIPPDLIYPSVIGH